MEPSIHDSIAEYIASGRSNRMEFAGHSARPQKVFSSFVPGHTDALFLSVHILPVVGHNPLIRIYGLVLLFQ